jgi:hypothetical protein
MFNLFQNQLDHVPVRVDGSVGKVTNGNGGKRDTPAGFNPEWFSGDHSFILGDTDPSNTKQHHAEWHIPVEREEVRTAEGGYLIIAAERRYAGLHTGHPKAGIEMGEEMPDVKIYLNTSVKDRFFIESKPENHTDHFYRSGDDDVRGLLESVKGIPEVWPVSRCRTLYSWPINKADLASGAIQTVKVELDCKVFWDIDYVLVALSRSRKQLHPELVKIAYLVLGSALTVVGRLLIR